MVKEKKKISTLVGTIIIIVAAVVIFGGVFSFEYYTNLQQQKIKIIPPPPKSQAQKIINTPFPVAGEPQQNPVNQIAGWQTYTNTQYGFEFQYPQGWTIDESGTLGTIVVFKNPTPVLDKEGNKFYPNINILTRSLKNLGVKNIGEYVSLDKSMVQQYVAKEVKFDPDEKVILGGGEEGYISGFSGLENNMMVHDMHLMVINDDGVYVISGTTLDSAWNDYKNLFREILTSFKFTN
jgi:hypothetical protein